MKLELSKESKKWTLNARNYIRGAIFAVAPPVLNTLIPVLTKGDFPEVTDIKKSLAYAVGYFFIYLLAHLPAGEK